MSQNIKQIIEENKAIYMHLVHKIRKNHRAEGHAKFLQGCIQHNVFPRFTFIEKNVIQKSGLNWQQVRRRRVSHLKAEQQKNVNNLAVTKTTLNEYKNYLFTIFDSRTFSKFINFASYFVTKGEKFSDQKRERKLTLLLKYKRKNMIVSI